MSTELLPAATRGKQINSNAVAAQSVTLRKTGYETPHQAILLLVRFFERDRDLRTQMVFKRDNSPTHVE